MSNGTTYYAGGTGISGTLVGTVTEFGFGVGYRSGWATSSLNLIGTTNDPPDNRIVFPQFSGVSLIWGHGRFMWPGLGGGTTNNATMYRLLDSSGVARIVVRGAGSGAVKVDTHDSMGNFVNLFTSANGVVPTSGSLSIPMDIKVNYAVSGSVQLWINNISVGSFSGDVTTESVAALAQADYSDPFTSQAIYWSEMFGSDSITINAGLFTLNPLAGGVTQLWAGSASDINKIGVDDTSFISDNTAGDLSGWTTPVSFPTGSWLIQSIVQEARAAVGLSGPQHFDWYCRTADGSDHLGGTSNAPTLFFGNFPNFIWPQNPHTAATWVQGDIVSGFNLGVKSLA